jgi:hypothetical protein
MQLYCRAGVVIATHGDDQNVPASAYGDGVSIIPVPDGAVLQRVGKAPAQGLVDARDYAAPEPTIELLKACAAHKRWLTENGGFTLSGITIRTDESAQRKISELRRRVDAGEIATPFEFKAANGWFALDAATITAVDRAIAAHVQACYATNKQVDDAIAAETITHYDEIDAAFAAIP